MKHTNQLTNDIEINTKHLLLNGYQKQLNYRHNDGLFSASGESDESASTLLTAFAAKSFRQAAEHIAIQDNIIDGALKWLGETQSTDGNLTENGSIECKFMTSKPFDDLCIYLSMTVYVLSSFLINKVNLTKQININN